MPSDSRAHSPSLGSLIPLQRHRLPSRVPHLRNPVCEPRHHIALLVLVERPPNEHVHARAVARPTTPHAGRGDDREVVVFRLEHRQTLVVEVGASAVEGQFCSVVRVGAMSQGCADVVSGDDARTHKQRRSGRDGNGDVSPMRYTDQ